MTWNTLYTRSKYAHMFLNILYRQRIYLSKLIRYVFLSWNVPYKHWARYMILTIRYYHVHVLSKFIVHCTIHNITFQPFCLHLYIRMPKPSLSALNISVVSSYMQYQKVAASIFSKIHYDSVGKIVSTLMFFWPYIMNWLYINYQLLCTDYSLFIKY